MSCAKKREEAWFRPSLSTLAAIAGGTGGVTPSKRSLVLPLNDLECGGIRSDRRDNRHTCCAVSFPLFAENSRNDYYEVTYELVEPTAQQRAAYAARPSWTTT